jgi:hypothetical protein
MNKGEGLWQQLDQKRNIHLYTGQKGAEELMKTFYEVGVRTPLRAHLADALKKKKVDLNQYETLLKMIDSEDRENVVLAEAILDEKHPVKKNQNSIRHGNPIYSPRPQISKRKRGGIY